MLNIPNYLDTTNTNDINLCLQTMFEELVLYARNPTNFSDSDGFTINKAFDGLEVIRFCGFDNYFENYKLIKEQKLNLSHLLGFELYLPPDFNFDCKQTAELNVLIRSEYCTDTTLLQNKIIDIFRAIFLDRDFFWQGEVATDIDAIDNTKNTTIQKYRITNVVEQKEKTAKSQIDKNYIISQINYKFKIFKNT